MSRYAFTLVIAALALERLFELRLSRRNAAWAKQAGAVEYGARHLVLMKLLHTAFFISALLEVWLLARPLVPALAGAGLALVLLAQALRYWAIGTLGRRWNARIIVVPDDPVVTSGPYRYLRHPNYVAVQLEMAAVPLIHGAWLTALVFSLGNLWLLSVRIRAEESALGPGWAAAFEGKPRFLPEVHRG